MEDFGKPNCSKYAKTSRADYVPMLSEAFGKEASEGPGFEAGPQIRRSPAAVPEVYTYTSGNGQCVHDRGSQHPPR